VDIQYCDNCNLKVTPADVSSGACRRTDEGQVYCPKCSPLFEHTSSALLQVLTPISINDRTTQIVPMIREPATSVTKFFFCETCGRRITDKQILEGQGRDKKLKGVYCKDCAEGVMTMEMDAVNIEQPANANHKKSVATDRSSVQVLPSSTAHKVSRQSPSYKSAPKAMSNARPELVTIGFVVAIGIISACIFMNNSQAVPLTPLKAPALKRELVENTTASLPKSTVVPVVITPVDNLHKQFATILNELDPILQKHQFSTAKQILSARRCDPAFAPVAELIDKEQADLADAQALRIRAMDALRAKAGAVFTLRSKAVTGIVNAAANSNVVKLTPSQGPELIVSADQLHGDDVNELLPIDKGKDRGEDLRRRGLIYLFANELVRAENYFVQARDAGLGEAIKPYLDRIARIATPVEEVNAGIAWRKAEALFESKNWTEAKKAYESLLREHGGSKVVAANAEKLKQHLAAMAH